MKSFDVYPIYNIEPERAKGAYIWDTQGNRYLDLYGGHAVISIGHSHPKYIHALTEQLNKIGFYSNAVKMPLQDKLAEKLGSVSGYTDYELYLCNSGAEANENAMKLASFHTGRKKVIAFKNSFHGRTSLAVAATDDAKLSAPINTLHEIDFCELNNIKQLQKLISEETAAVIIEGIQGVGGIQIPENNFLAEVQKLCKQKGVLLILDEIQSGYGRTGKFFAHQYADVKPDLITVAKGMGNGFPIAGVLISPFIKAKHGMLGTTFGGNHLACAAAICVLDVIKEEQLIKKAFDTGSFLMKELKQMDGIKEVRGKGLMIGVDTHVDAAVLRKELLLKGKVFTGYSSSTGTIRLLPPLNISRSEAEEFLEIMQKTLQKQLVLKS